jgi:hypothetical protein
VEVWTKPIGGGRTAAFIINTAVHNDTTVLDTGVLDTTVLDTGVLDTTVLDVVGISADVGTLETGTVNDGAGASAGGDGMSMVACDSNRRSQTWTLGDGVVPGDGVITNLKANGCNKPGT